MAPKTVEKTKKAKTTVGKPAIEKEKIKRTKKDKDPDQPKRPQSAYFLWMNASRADIKAANSQVPQKEILKIAGGLWKNMSEDDKKEWHNKAEEAKELYKEQMENYNGGKSNGGGQKAQKSGSGKKQQVPMEEESDGSEEYSDE